MAKLAFFVLLILLTQLAAAENETNQTNQTGVTLGGVGDKLADEATNTGNETLDAITNFLAGAGPFILIAIGILIFLLSGIAKWIAIILILLGIAKLLFDIFAA